MTDVSESLQVYLSPESSLVQYAIILLIASLWAKLPLPALAPRQLLLHCSTTIRPVRITHFPVGKKNGRYATISYRPGNYTQLPPALLPWLSPSLSSLHLIWRDGTTVEIACL